MLRLPPVRCSFFCSVCHMCHDPAARIDRALPRILSQGMICLLRHLWLPLWSLMTPRWAFTPTSSTVVRSTNQHWRCLNFLPPTCLPVDRCGYSVLLLKAATCSRRALTSVFSSSIVLAIDWTSRTSTFSAASAAVQHDSSRTAFCTTASYDLVLSSSETNPYSCNSSLRRVLCTLRTNFDGTRSLLSSYSAWEMRSTLAAGAGTCMTLFVLRIFA